MNTCFSKKWQIKQTLKGSFCLQMYLEGQQYFLNSAKITDINETIEYLWKSDEN